MGILLIIFNHTVQELVGTLHHAAAQHKHIRITDTGNRSEVLAEVFFDLDCDLLCLFIVFCSKIEDIAGIMDLIFPEHSSSLTGYSCTGSFIFNGADIEIVDLFSIAINDNIGNFRPEAVFA